MKYIFKQAIFINGEIVGYELIDESGQIKRAKLTDIFQLIERDMLDGEVVTDDQGNKHIIFKDIPLQKKDDIVLIVECRFIKNGQIDSYRCTDNSQRKLKIKPDRLWEYASSGNVTNIEAKMINNKRVLVGKGVSMKTLPTIDT